MVRISAPEDDPENTPPTPDAARSMALRHNKRYEWANLDAVEASIRVRGAAAGTIAAFGRCLSSLGMKSTARYAVLRELHFAENTMLSQMELSRDISVTSASMTYLIDCLEEDGLVARSKNPANRRITSVQLTPAGKTLCDRLVPAVAAFVDDMFADFSAEDLASFNSALDRLQRKAATMLREA